MAPGICILNSTLATARSINKDRISSAGYQCRLGSCLPDMLFSKAGTTVAFLITDSGGLKQQQLLQRLDNISRSFRTAYVLVTLGNGDDWQDLVHLACQYMGRPSFVMLPQGMDSTQKSLSITAHVMSSKYNVRHEQRIATVEHSDAVKASLMSIPGVSEDQTDTLTLVGSLQHLAQSMPIDVLQNTDLDEQQAVAITEFFQSS